MCLYLLVFFFFFQAEDGIRDVAVTGVQTCALPISCAQPDVSSTSVRIARRWFVTNASPTAAASFMNRARLASIDIHSVTSRALNAQASTTWVPWVLTTLMRCPAWTRAALPRRAGIVTSWVFTGPPSSSAGFAGAIDSCAEALERVARRGP